jgi:hypothetical protein
MTHHRATTASGQVERAPVVEVCGGGGRGGGDKPARARALFAACNIIPMVRANAAAVTPPTLLLAPALPFAAVELVPVTCNSRCTSGSVLLAEQQQQESPTDKHDPTVQTDGKPTHGLAVTREDPVQTEKWEPRFE